MGRLALDPTQRSQKFVTFEDRIEYTPGKKQRVKFTKDDYLTEILLVSDMQVVVGAVAPVISGWGAFGPLGTVTVRGSNSKREPVSLPAAYLDNYYKVRSQTWTNPLASDPVPINSTSAWNNSLLIPLTIDEQSDKGAFFLGDQGLTVEVELDMLPLASVFTAVNGATITGGWSVWRVNYNAPPPDDVADPRAAAWLDNISYMRQLRIYDTSITKNGDTTIELPTSEDYLRLMLQFYDGSNSDGTFVPNAAAFTKLKLRVNDKVDLVPEWTPGLVQLQQARDYRGVLLPGFVVIDYMREWNSRRDVLPTDPTLARTLRLTLSSTGVHNCDVIVESSVDSPWADKYFRARARQKTGAAKKLAA